MRALLVSQPRLVGLHVRNVFDAPRDDATNVSTRGAEAVDAARREYGADGTQQLLKWRRVSHWENFVPQIKSMIERDDRVIARRIARKSAPADDRALPGTTPLKFYLAADTDEAYAGLTARFPGRILYTPRPCAAARCDFRDCAGLFYALVDMYNLAQARTILGSGWSSYSEVAAYLGGSGGRPIAKLMVGRDFGKKPDGAAVQAYR